ncbi:MAG: hypothetical protein AB8B88_10855 [Devosiaceae bacterium]
MQTKPLLENIQAFRRALPQCWSLRSSSRWAADNPALGQCGVTALVAHQLFGGDILKTSLGDMWHFYNRIDGVCYDFTESQFDSPVQYDHESSSRAEAFGDTNADQFRSLGGAVAQALNVDIDVEAFDD